MQAIPHVLGSTGPGSYIGVIVFLVIWGISAMSAVVKKANEAAAKQKGAVRRPPVAPPQLQAAPLLRRPSQQRVQLPRRAVPPAIQRAAALSQMPAPPVRPPQPPPILPAPHAAVALSPVTIPIEHLSRAGTSTASITDPAGPRPVVRSADAAALRRWLKPETVRQQFIVTELFQPPLALRDSLRI